MGSRESNRSPGTQSGTGPVTSAKIPRWVIMAAFSPSPEVPEVNIRDERALILRNLSSELNAAYVSRQVGKDAEVILEGRRLGKWHGLTGNYLKLDVSGAPDNASVGDLFKVRIKSKDLAEVIL